MTFLSTFLQYYWSFFVHNVHNSFSFYILEKDIYYKFYTITYFNVHDFLSTFLQYY